MQSRDGALQFDGGEPAQSADNNLTLFLLGHTQSPLFLILDSLSDLVFNLEGMMKVINELSCQVLRMKIQQCHCEMIHLTFLKV